EWKKLNITPLSFATAVENAYNSQSNLFLLKNHFENILVTFKDGTLSIKDFLVRFNSSKITAKASEKRKLYNQLNHQIAITVRNHFFIEEALLRELDKSLDVENELKIWRDKWVYEELRKQYTDSVSIDEATALEYFNAHKYQYKTQSGIEPTFNEFVNQAKHDAYFDTTFKILENKIALLKKDFPVRINKELLDLVNVQDSEKSRWANVFLFKGNGSRMAIPIVDPYWSLKSAANINN
ncbi:MAG: hypothetical protein PF445_04915, partial [Melioribacteraceae bacterium]|nr:hypothetical protein [Melioribacteraceae bacterium]